MLALSQRHADDVFVPECKNGPTQSGSHRRFDAWVLRKTWSPVTTIGYEVKVSRSDWRRDEKLSDYMGLCHLLYVVAPKGVVSMEELPEGVGLLEPAGASGRLVTRRKAPRREIELPSMLMVYVLMCRVQITRERSTGYSDPREWRAEALKRWVEGKEERQKLHYAVSNKIREAFEAQERRQRELAERLRALEHIERRMVELGFDPTQSVREWDVTSAAERLAGSIDRMLVPNLKQAEHSLIRARESIERMMVPAPGLRVLEQGDNLG